MCVRQCVCVCVCEAVCVCDATNIHVFSFHYVFCPVSRSELFLLTSSFWGWCTVSLIVFGNISEKRAFHLWLCGNSALQGDCSSC